MEYSYQKIDNYKIRKLPDGTLILSGKITNPAAGGRPDVTKLTFPVSFADDDYEMFATEIRENGDTATYNLAFVQPVDKSNANICTWYGGSTFWQAIGRWK